MRVRFPIAFVLLVTHLVVLGASAAFWSSAVLPWRQPDAAPQVARAVRVGNLLLGGQALLVAVLWIVFVVGHRSRVARRRVGGRRPGPPETPALELRAPPGGRAEDAALAARIEEVVQRHAAATTKARQRAVVLQSLRGELEQPGFGSAAVLPLEVALAPEEHEGEAHHGACNPAPHAVHACMQPRAAMSDPIAAADQKPEEEHAIVLQRVPEAWETERVVFTGKWRATSRARVWLRKLGNRLRDAGPPNT